MKRQNSLTTLLILAISGCYVVDRYLGIDLFTKFALVGRAYTQHNEYFASLVAGSAFSWKFMPPQGVAVGASGMIFGLFGALLVLGRRIGLNYNAVIGTVIINLALPFFVSNIDWHAHIGGLVGGALATSLITLNSKL